MSFRRFFVGLKDKKDTAKFNNIYKKNDSIPHERIQLYKLCHMHVWEFDSPLTQQFVFQTFIVINFIGFAIKYKKIAQLYLR